MVKPRRLANRVRFESRKVFVINNRIREWRKFRGLTLEQLADQTSFTVGALSQVETGRTGYSERLVEELAPILRCKPGDLISTDPEEAEVDYLLKSLPHDKRDLAIKTLVAMGAKPS